MIITTIKGFKELGDVGIKEFSKKDQVKDKHSRETTGHLWGQTSQLPRSKFKEGLVSGQEGLLKVSRQMEIKITKKMPRSFITSEVGQNRSAQPQKLLPRIAGLDQFK